MEELIANIKKEILKVLEPYFPTMTINSMKIHIEEGRVGIRVDIFKPKEWKYENSGSLIPDTASTYYYGNSTNEEDINGG